MTSTENRYSFTHGDKTINLGQCRYDSGNA